jgi:hypothetical protein
MQTQAFRDLESHEQASLQQRVQGCMQQVQYLRHAQQQRQQLEQQQQSSSPGTGMGEPLLQTTQAQPPPSLVQQPAAAPTTSLLSASAASAPSIDGGQGAGQPRAAIAVGAPVEAVGAPVEAGGAQKSKTADEDGRSSRLTWDCREVEGHDRIKRVVQSILAYGTIHSGYGMKGKGCDEVALSLRNQEGFSFPGYAPLSGESVKTHLTNALKWGKLRSTTNHPNKPSYNTSPPSLAFRDTGKCELDDLIDNLWERELEFQRMLAQKKEAKVESNAHKDGAARVMQQALGQVQDEYEELNGVHEVGDGEEGMEEDADDGVTSIYMGGNPDTPLPNPYTLTPKPATLNPIPRTRNPKQHLSSLIPQPHRPGSHSPKTYTLNPEPALNAGDKNQKRPSPGGGKQARGGNPVTHTLYPFNSTPEV